MARPEKVQAVKDIAGRFTDTDAILLTEYRGLRVSDIAEVRSALRESETDYKVLKNTLTRIAVREVGLEDLVALLEGPTAIAFVKGDVAAAAKVLDDAARKFPVLTIKGGVLNGKVIDAEQARQLAKLEPRELLLAKIAMLFNAPAQQTVNVFSALLRDLGSMLTQVIAKKESGELPGGTGEAEPEAPAAAAEPEAPAAEAAPEASTEPIPAASPGDETLEQPEVDAAEKAEEIVQPETEQQDEAEAAAEEAEPPAETQETTESGSKEEDQ